MATPHDTLAERIAASLERIQGIEKNLWAASPTEALLNEYHTAFQQLEQHIASGGPDTRHEFVIIIPVADRPQHLKSCLDSLLHLCKMFAYGGFSDKRYQKISAIIADDSKFAENILQHKAIANECNMQGLTTLYFGLEEQLDLMDTLKDSDKSSLSGILGSTREDAFYHKGPSIMRNLAYMELNKIQGEKILYYFIDSDQEFQLKISTAEGDKNVYACNYFYHLDQIFSKTDTRILTGKVVGDPPVSPAVMTGNFLEDVINFLHQLAAFQPALPCRFHDTKIQHQDGAAYHDMAALFGFKPSTESFQYACGILGEHDNAQCFSHFSKIIGHFFYGEHPTRKTYYQHEELIASIKPARTVYTGNYIFKPECLKHFIPFAALKLRMAGPVLGRLIQAELGKQFATANLPMLHNRTVQETGQSEFRPGVSANPTNIDLSGEFERQFYGDVMLFTIEKLTAMGFPGQAISHELIDRALQETRSNIYQQYSEKQRLISAKLLALKNILSDQTIWWNQSSAYAGAVGLLNIFIGNIEHNFGNQSAGYALINSAENQSKRHAEIHANIASYRTDRQTWEAILAQPPS